eukprot:Skav234765  [mRNA]  locus=scaffold2396:49006:52599:- [translate_table: standard]
MNIYERRFLGERGEAGKVVATWLLREALKSSLQRVLRYHAIREGAVAFGDLKTGPDPLDALPGAVLSGSTMVQVALGEVWKDSDIDIFCTAAAARAVRSKLVKNGFTLARFHDNYSDSGSGLMGHLLESKVHHVEGWAPTPQDGEVPKRLEGWAESPRAFNFQESCRYGRIASKRFAEFSSNLLPFKCQMGRKRATDIRALEGDALSYNYQLTDTLDLVVAQSSCSDARELLKSFDLLICAAYYDGESFHIPHPHMTFQKRSSMDPLRLSMMKAFQTEWKKHHGKVNEGIEDFHESHWFKAIEKSLQDAGIKDSQWITNRDTSFPGRFYWNFFAKLFLRQKKYAQRGIKIDRPRGFAAISSKIRVDNIPIAY